MARPILHTRYLVDAAFVDKATPVLALLKKNLDDRTGLHQMLTETAKVNTRRWIRLAAQTRHSMANELGATPTGYLEKRARDVEGESTKATSRIIVKGAIFARVTGPVTILPKRAKMLTVPISKDSYGKRAADFDNLFFKFSKKTGKSFLVRKVGRRIQPLFMLLKSATLPQDAGLLPGNKEYAQWSEAAAIKYLRDLLANGAAVPV